MNPFKIIACTLIACTLGCQDSDSDNVVREELVPRGQSGEDIEPGLCPGEWKGLDQFGYINLGTSSWFYGIIEKVEGYTERYWTVDERGNDQYVTAPCGNTVEMAVAVYVRPERTS